WWEGLMARTALSTQLGFIPAFGNLDITADLSHIACPTLVITTQHSPMSTVDETRAWQTQIPGSRLLVLPGDSYHVAASDADECARLTMEFIAQAETAQT